MRLGVCTLFEGNYHYGLGALVNSLHASGFKGCIWAGYRGDLPPWALPLRTVEGHGIYSVSEDCEIRFVPVQTKWHLTNYKPVFMLQVFDCDPGLQGLVYIDPDITIRCGWDFVRDWVSFGVALVEDITNGTMPADHPIRRKWAQFSTRLGMTGKRNLTRYYNGGFVGVSRNHQSCLHLWKRLIEELPGEGINLAGFMAAGREHPFGATDQDTLNLMAMTTEEPLSTIGPEGMDFVPGGFTMTHGVGSPKPWNKHMIAQALDGRRPSPADHAFFKNVTSPITLYSPLQLRFKKLKLRCAAAIGRLWSR
jgi:hypothetical protein